MPREVCSMNVSESMTARDFYNFASQHYEEIKDARENYGFSWDTTSAHLFTLTGVYVFPNVLECYYNLVSEMRSNPKARKSISKRLHVLERYRILSRWSLSPILCNRPQASELA